MIEQEKMEIVAEILEVEPEEVVLEKKLEEYDTWDSVAVLSVITIMNEKFERFPSAKEILVNKTVDDLIRYMCKEAG